MQKKTKGDEFDSLRNLLYKLMDKYQHLSEYAETKLGAITAFNSAIIFGLMAIFNNQELLLQWCNAGVILLNSISLFVALVGIYAITKNERPNVDHKVGKNYFYYKYIATLDSDDFIEEILSDYGLETKNFKLESDIANQVVVLAKIADRKFRFFNCSLNITIASFLVAIVSLVIYAAKVLL